MRKVEAMRDGENTDPHLELLSAVRICHPGWNSAPRATFSPDLGASKPWIAWNRNVFGPVLRAQLESAFYAAMSGDLRSLAACESALEKLLPERAAADSRACGRDLIEKFPAPPSEKLWLRYQRSVAAGEPGHLVVAAAVRAAAFHLPAPVLISAYIFLEIRAGLPAAGMNAWMEAVGECVCSSRPAGLPQIKAA